VAHALAAPVSALDSAHTKAPALHGRRMRKAETDPHELASRPAPLRHGLVPRPRLVRRLLDARALPVALIVAPAGYGKTTVLSEWDTCDRRPFAWVKLDADDNDARTLLSAIVVALDSAEPVGWDVREALGSGAPDATAVVLRRLVRSLGRRERPAVLVLDDLQMIRSRESRQLVTALSRACGVGLQLALASRSDDVLPVARLRAHGESVELRAEELAMTRSEASALLQMAGVELSPEQVLTLVRRTEGWPAGLHLAALSLREEGLGAAGVEGFGGEDRFVADYAREELLSVLPPAQLEFVTRTSVLDRVSAPACNAVLGRNDSADMLARLMRANVMLKPLDRRGTAYRYHGLFGDALRAELRRREPEHEPVLHMRASAWYAAGGDVARAISHAIEGGDVQRAGSLLWDSTLQHVARGEHRAIWAWLDRFSDKAVAGTPLLALVAAATSLAEGNLYEAERWTTLARRNSDRSDVVQAAVAVMQAAIGRGGLIEIEANAARAAELLCDGSPWRPLCLFLLGVVRHLTGNAAEARELLEEGAHLAAAPTPLIQTLCLAQLALLAAGDDDVERAVVIAGRARAQIVRCGLDDYPMAALAFAVSAELGSRSGRVAEAAADLRRALRLLGRITDPSPWYEAETRIVAARATLRLSGPAPAAELLGQATTALRRAPDAPELRLWLDQAIGPVDAALDSNKGADWALTAAEVRVLGYLPSHFSFREIGERLYVSPNTVKTHVRGIYRKLGVSSRGEAVDHARTVGLVEPGTGG
jgi:LuxR family transcriptional regulator, maltose regulon positive regulatory protein